MAGTHHSQGTGLPPHPLTHSGAGRNPLLPPALGPSVPPLVFFMTGRVYSGRKNQAVSQVKGCTDTGNCKHGQLHILHPGWLVFSSLGFPAAAAARWVPTAGVAGPPGGGGTKPASGSSCPSCVRCKNKAGAKNRGGEGTFRAGMLSNVFLQPLRKYSAGLARVPGTVHAHSGHRAPFVTVTHPPLGSSFSPWSVLAPTPAAGPCTCPC